MYHYSRAIFRAVKDLIDEREPEDARTEARRRVLAACEDTLARLADDPRYFARPSQSLFEDIRRYFPIQHQAQVRVAVDGIIGMAADEITRELERAGRFDGRCRALTRKGRPCQRAPLPDGDYCPSHQNLPRRRAPLASLA
jgi:hypothetical protein